MVLPEPLDDSLLFVPATGPEEAIARLFALTEAADPGTRGPKRALEALAVSVGLAVDLAATNAVLGSQIAQALRLEWHEGRDYVGLRVTLDGLNDLLRGASRRLWRTAQRTSIDADSYSEVLRAFPAFRPAQDKQEAIDRLSSLAGVPSDRLGPGGKEHRITFDSLAHRFAPQLLRDGEARSSKHSMVRALCSRFGVPWVSTAGSTGQSVTLEGLNLLLAGVERHARVASGGWASAREEAAALVRVLRVGLEEHWDGQTIVELMRDEGSRNWRQMEWPGWYFEERVGALLNSAYPTPSIGGPRRQYGSTIFDYASSTRVWDAKAHTIEEVLIPSGRRVSTARSAAILNDADAVSACLAEQGLGFLILDGATTFDETGAFDEWHRRFTREGRDRASYTPNSAHRRRRKAAFTPVRLRAIWIDNLAALNAGIAGGWVLRAKQGSQQARLGEERGADRNEKFQLRVDMSAPWVVAQEDWLSVGA